jgi:hypothetical protein
VLDGSTKSAPVPGSARRGGIDLIKDLGCVGFVIGGVLVGIHMCRSGRWPLGLLVTAIFGFTAIALLAGWGERSRKSRDAKKSPGE